MDPRESNCGAATEWIIVAARQDEDIIDLVLKRATMDGVKIGRVLWTDNGPIRVYSCAQDLWRDLLDSPRPAGGGVEMERG